jgi:hypothetical protein
MARREVDQLDAVVLTALVSCAGCVGVSAPSPTLGRLLWTDLIPGFASGPASCRCWPLPDWLPQLARRGSSGRPKFPSPLSSRAMRFDPGRSAAVSPVATALVLGSADATASPPALTVSRLDGFSGVRLPLTACEVPCVCFQRVVRLASPAAMPACPSLRQHSVLGGWLGLSIQFFRSEFVMFIPCQLEGLSPSEVASFAWRTASQFLLGS